TAFYEFGKMYGFPLESRFPNDFAAGIVAETAVGPFFIGGSAGDTGHYKWFFQLGKGFLPGLPGPASHAGSLAFCSKLVHASASVGCANVASFRTVHGNLPIIASCACAMISPPSRPRIATPRN